METSASTEQKPSAFSLKDVFNETAADAVLQFPQQLDNFYLASAVTGQIYVSPVSAQLLTDCAQTAKAGIEDAIQFVRTKGMAGLAKTVEVKKKKSFFHTERKDFNLVIMNADEKFLSQDMQFQASGKFSPAIHMISILDHEIGHHVAPGGKGESYPNLMESAADAYAALRHVQRFGNDTDFFDNVTFTRTRLIVHNKSPFHYTTAVMQKIEKLRKEMDLSALSPQETAELAGKIAHSYCMPPQVIQKVAFAFQPLKIYMAQKGIGDNPAPSDSNIGYFRLLVDIMRRNKDDHDVYRAGKLIISKHLDTLKGEAAKDPFWKEALSFMEGHEKSSGIILNLAAALDARRKPKNQMSPRYQ